MELISQERTSANVIHENQFIELPLDEFYASTLAECAPFKPTGRIRRSLARRRLKIGIRRPATAGVRKVRTTEHPASADELVVGTLAQINDIGEPLVQHPLDRSGRVMIARTTVPIGPEQVDRQVVLAFESGNLDKPIILGVILPPETQKSRERRIEAKPKDIKPIVQATLDGEELVLTAKREIVLRCGKASITLTRAGKIIIRGTYLLSRSSGVNQVKGGSVQIN